MEPVIVEVTPDAVEVRINRPARRNAMNRALTDALHDAVRRARDVPRPLVIRSAAPAMFVSGTDLDDLTRRDRDDALGRYNAELFQTVDDHPHPTVAVVDGPALGGGCELALACDFRIASTRSVWGLPEVTLGLVPAAGGLWRLSRLVGLGHALDLVLTGRRLPAAEARAIGLVQQVVEPDGLDLAVSGLLDRLNAAAPAAQRLAKEILKGGEGDRRRLIDAMAMALCYESDDARQRLGALVNRR